MKEKKMKLAFTSLVLMGWIALGYGDPSHSQNPYVVNGSDLVLKSQLKKIYCNQDGFNPDCYIFSNHKATWEQARQNCLNMGTDLVKITSTIEHNYILNQLGDNAWIGLNDRGTEGLFRWADGSSLKRSWWGPGEPNNSGNSEDCVQYRQELSPPWNDAPCDNVLKYVCEKPSLDFY